MKKIDWPNHIVAFFSALFGILIAFELDEWKESRKDVAIAENAYVRLKQEIDINRNMLHEMVRTNLGLIAELQGNILPRVNEKLLFTGTVEEANAINGDPRLSTFVFVHMHDEPITRGKERELGLHVMFSGLIHPVIHNSAWESAKTIGALNNMSYEKVLSLSSLYNPARLMDEVAEVRNLLRNADEIRSKQELEKLLSELEDAYHIIEAELAQFDAFAGMLDQMD